MDTPVEDKLVEEKLHEAGEYGNRVGDIHSAPIKSNFYFKILPTMGAPVVHFPKLAEVPGVRSTKEGSGMTTRAGKPEYAVQFGSFRYHLCYICLFKGGKINNAKLPLLYGIQ